MSDSALAGLLFVQLAVILATCRGLGWLFARARQPLVVAEMVGGFLLGPSFLGWLAPSVQARLFPPESMRTLYALSQIGLALYMFSVGLEFRVDLVARWRRRAIGVSAAGIVAPFALAAVLAVALLRLGGFFADTIRPIHAVLFLGAAMSITAFPVLARIISERGIAGTTIGSLTLAAGAIDDAAAWIILAIVLGSFSGSATAGAIAAGGALAYVLVLFAGVRRLLTPVAAAAERVDRMRTSTLVTILCLLATGAWFTDAIGIHSVFGAFMLGVVVPRGVLSRELRHSVEPLTIALLVPLFFVYSGLNTRLLLLDSAGMWLITLAVFGAACAAKGAACWAAARLSGAPPRHALAIGTLMNARGMVELVLANIGLERGLITPTLFVILVLMAIGTTLMAGPMFSLIWEGAPEAMETEAWLAIDRAP